MYKSTSADCEIGRIPSLALVLAYLPGIRCTCVVNRVHVLILQVPLLVDINSSKYKLCPLITTDVS